MANLNFPRCGASGHSYLTPCLGSRLSFGSACTTALEWESVLSEGASVILISALCAKGSPKLFCTG